jgi:hypothetical protein
MTRVEQSLLVISPRMPPTANESFITVLELTKSTLIAKP